MFVQGLWLLQLQDIFGKKNNAHELKNEERGRKMILSTKFHGLKESLLSFKKEPNQAESV